MLTPPLEALPLIAFGEVAPFATNDEPEADWASPRRAASSASSFELADCVRMDRDSGDLAAQSGAAAVPPNPEWADDNGLFTIADGRTGLGIVQTVYDPTDLDLDLLHEGASWEQWYMEPELTYAWPNHSWGEG